MIAQLVQFPRVIFKLTALGDELVSLDPELLALLDPPQPTGEEVAVEAIKMYWAPALVLVILGSLWVIGMAVR